jgi:hypothetical protein
VKTLPCLVFETEKRLETDIELKYLILLANFSFCDYEMHVFGTHLESMPENYLFCVIFLPSFSQSCRISAD